MATRGGRYQGHCDKRVSLASRTLTRARARTSQACLPSRQIAYFVEGLREGHRPAGYHRRADRDLGQGALRPFFSRDFDPHPRGGFPPPRVVWDPSASCSISIEPKGKACVAA